MRFIETLYFTILFWKMNDTRIRDTLNFLNIFNKVWF